tara:strand:- start:1156 stop:2424 length:1269 start_codon:yes stop_codon:yes gene_type:complete
MKINNGKIQEYSIWSKSISFREKKMPLSYVKKTLYKKLENAVSKQMIADVPVGCFLSGGLDSSTVAYFASKINPNIQCYVIKIIGSDSIFNEDLKYAMIITKALKLKLHVVEVNAYLMAKDLEKMIYDLEEPIADPSALYVKYISAVARSHGIKVLLSGIGGDDIFSGYRRHLTINLYKYFKLIPFNLFIFFRKILLNKYLITKMRRLYKLIFSYDKNLNQQIINLFTWIDSDNLKLIFKNKYSNIVKIDKENNPFDNYLKNFEQETNYLSKILSVEQRFFLTEHNLIYNDKMSMSESVEVRVPFLEDELVNFVNSIPYFYKIRYFNSKWILKQTMLNYLPKSIIFRKKVGFGAPIRTWIKKDLKHLVNELLSEKNIKKRGIFEYSAIKKLIDKNNQGLIDASYSILSLMCIEIWLRKFYDE